ncbi:LAMI_0B00870g1_1 [Lachancea mirantina]|uniref:Adenine deaminase n=1 Tax=Lachancea mirantina TaxID=1230905 RepID=A0A1G4IT39_9SACH|nr:LAMI_0B00870g1_1 [Lachancea mirantina]
MLGKPGGVPCYCMSLHPLPLYSRHRALAAGGTPQTSPGGSPRRRKRLTPSPRNGDPPVTCRYYLPSRCFSASSFFFCRIGHRRAALGAYIFEEHRAGPARRCSFRPQHSMSDYTCSQTMRDFLRELPKCEHHVHLEGTLEPDLLFPLAKRNNVSLPADFPSSAEALHERYNRFADLADFLHFYYIGTNVLLLEQDFFDLAWAYFQRAAAQGLRHAEMFFDPQSHTTRGVALDAVVGGFRRACERAETELGVTSKLIMCLLRHLPVPECLATVQSAQPFFESGTVQGLGLDSAERPFPPELFTECYEQARRFQPELRLTAHAGEEGPASYVTTALDLLGAQRIDHGVRCVEDAALVARLASSDTLLTVCPLSNVRLQVVQHVRELPLQKLLDAGVPFSLNSDDPAYFGGYVLDNYVAVQQAFGWSRQTWARVAGAAVRGSWCDDKRKTELLDQIERVVAKYEAIAD